MRLFVAVNLDDTVRDALHDALDAFPVTSPPWRWAAAATWHVTLAFLGETPRSDLGTIVRALDTVRVRHRAFSLRLGAFGAFPSLRAPRVLFYHVDEGHAAVAALAHDVGDALHECVGLARESRAFHAHVTVARLKDPPSADVVAALSGVPGVSHPATVVSAVDLMESRLGPRGAQYSVVKQFALPGGGC